MPKPMRLDLARFQRERYAGVIVAALLAVGVLASTLALNHLALVSSLYLESAGNSIASSSMFEILVSKLDKPLAVMFQSPTCPVCKKMYPYWAKLEEASDTLPIAFYHVMYGPETSELFIRFRVDETPTFIVFIDGEPVARWVGGFQGENITMEMLEWALSATGVALASNPEKLAEEGLEVFKAKCASCHGAPRSFNVSDVRRWVQEGLVKGDLLARRLSAALEQGTRLSGLYGSYDLLLDAVSSMRKYVDLTSYDVDRAAYLLEYVSSILLGKEPPKLINASILQPKASGSGEATPLKSVDRAVTAPFTALAAVAVGVAAAFSPCVLPILASYVATLATSASNVRVTAASCTLCGVASFAGVFAVAAAFLLLGGLVAGIQQLILPTIGAAVLALGAAIIAGANVELNAIIPIKRRGGLAGFCALYGFLSVQCNLPMVVGALLMVLGATGVQGLMAALGFALGVSVPVAIAVYVSSKLGAGVVARLVEKSNIFNLVGGMALFASGLYLLLYSFNIV